MRIVARETKVPLEMPAVSATLLGRYPGQSLGATTSAGRSGYAVNLYWTDTPRAVNSPLLTRDIGLGSVLGSFGGTRYASARAAHKHLTTAMPYYFSKAPAGARLTRITLVPGVVAQVVSGTNILGQVNWRQDGWRFQVNQVADVTLARTIARYVEHHRLPKGPGLFVVASAGDGEHTNANWVVASMVYEASNYHLALSALAMADSMTPYPPHASRAGAGGPS